MNLQEDAKLLFLSVILAYQKSVIYFAQMSFIGIFDREQGILKSQYVWPFKVVKHTHTHTVTNFANQILFQTPDCYTLKPTNIHVYKRHHKQMFISGAHAADLYVRCTSSQSRCNQFDEKTMHWKIKLQVASILIRFM